MNQIKAFALVGIFQSFIFASHTCETNATGYCTEDASVDYIQSGKDGGVMACFDKNISNSAFPCAHGAKCVTADPNDPGTKGMLSILLTAKSTGSKVDVYVSDNQCIYPSDASGWIKLTSVVIDQ